MKYEELLEKIDRGAKFSIDLKKRTLKVNGKSVDLSGIEYNIDTSKPLIPLVEELYGYYKRSIPSERSESRQRNYFKALKYEQLSDDDMLYGVPREHARFELEFCILKTVYDGILKWDESWGSWFWQSKKDKDLVILREWIEPSK